MHTADKFCLKAIRDVKAIKAITLFSNMWFAIERLKGWGMKESLGACSQNKIAIF